MLDEVDEKLGQGGRGQRMTKGFEGMWGNLPLDSSHALTTVSKLELGKTVFCTSLTGTAELLPYNAFPRHQVRFLDVARVTQKPLRPSTINTQQLARCHVESSSRCYQPIRKSTVRGLCNESQSNHLPVFVMDFIDQRPNLTDVHPNIATVFQNDSWLTEEPNASRGSGQKNRASF